MVLIAHCIALHLLLFSFSKKGLRLEALKLYWILSKLCKHVLFHTLFTTIRGVRDHAYLLKSVRLASFSMVNINPDLYSIVQINCCPAKDHQHLGYPAASFSNLTNELLQEDRPIKIWILHACTKYSLIFKILYYFSVSVFSKQEKWVKNNNMHPKIQLPFNISTFRHVALFHMERG